LFPTVLQKFKLFEHFEVFEKHLEKPAANGRSPAFASSFDIWLNGPAT
jgi:hypothetical protein